MTFEAQEIVRREIRRLQATVELKEVEIEQMKDMIQQLEEVLNKEFWRSIETK